MRIHQKSPIGLILVTAAYLTVLGNIAFFAKAFENFPIQANSFFLGSLVVFIWLVTVLLSVLLSTRYTLKAWLILLVFITATSSYFTQEFGVVIDETMLINALETNSSEALDLVNWKLIVFIALGAVLPSFLILRWPLEYGRWFIGLRNSVALMVIAIASVLVCVYSASSTYASFFREYKDVRTYSNPVYPIYSVIKLAKRHFADARPNTLQQVSPAARVDPDDEDRELLIFIVGETARADHFSLYGYPRKTNPVLESQPSIKVFHDMTSCGTSTAVSVPCMFSVKGRKEFDLNTAKYEENVLDVLARAGVSVLWRDNNSSSKGVADRVRYEDFKSPGVNPICDQECRDPGMLDGLQQYIDQQKGDILIVLHMMGSHGPAYFKRVPHEFAQFQPACNSIKLSDCSNEEIVNAYDNTILYTDYFLGEVIALLKNNSTQFEVGMFYVSDHGESLGENGTYLHGMPYLFAPQAQTQVPALAWFGDHNDIDEQNLPETLNRKLSHDFLFNALLGYFEVEPSPDVRVKSEIVYEE